VSANVARQCREVPVAETVYCSVCHLLVDPAGDNSEGRLVCNPVGEHADCVGLETRASGTRKHVFADALLLALGF
jgi:hypothetical protein